MNGRIGANEAASVTVFFVSLVKQYGLLRNISQKGVDQTHRGLNTQISLSETPLY
jgi:hypothetical protein